MTLEKEKKMSVGKVKSHRVVLFIGNFSEQSGTTYEMINHLLVSHFFLPKFISSLSQRKIILENYDLARGATILKICLHDSPGCCVGISIYRNGPKMPEKHQFFGFKLGIFGGKLGKKEDIFDWERGRISDPGDRKKRPC